MDKDIRTIILRDEPKPFLFVKPLHGAMRHNMILLASGVRECRYACAGRRKKPQTAFVSP
jgi:hypothetical protein